MDSTKHLNLKYQEWRDLYYSLKKKKSKNGKSITLTVLSEHWPSFC